MGPAGHLRDAGGGARMPAAGGAPSDRSPARLVARLSLHGRLAPFALAQLRVSCRSGLRPRGFLVDGIVDSVDVGRTLASRWGFRARIGEVRAARHYDAVSVRVSVDGRAILELELRDPD